jgi:hypothetical protein
MTPVKGERYVAYPDERPCHRLFIEIKRVARDDSWADVWCMTWAVAWSKRQPLKDGGFPFAIRQDWGHDELAAQEIDHMAMLKEKS